MSCTPAWFPPFLSMIPNDSRFTNIRLCRHLGVVGLCLFVRFRVVSLPNAIYILLSNFKNVHDFIRFSIKEEHENMSQKRMVNINALLVRLHELKQHTPTHTKSLVSVCQRREIFYPPNANEDQRVFNSTVQKFHRGSVELAPSKQESVASSDSNSMDKNSSVVYAYI